MSCQIALNYLMFCEVTAVCMYPVVSQVPKVASVISDKKIRHTSPRGNHSLKNIIYLKQFHNLLKTVVGYSLHQKKVYTCGKTVAVHRG